MAISAPIDIQVANAGGTAIVIISSDLKTMLNVSTPDSINDLRDTKKAKGKGGGGRWDGKIEN